MGRPARTIPVSQDAVIQLTLAFEKMVAAVLDFNSARKQLIADANRRQGRAA